MKALESSIEKPVIQYARRRAIFVTKLKMVGQRGAPDDVFWLPGGRPLLIEFKRPGKKPTELQKHTIEKLKKLGYYVEVCDNKEHGFRLIDNYF